MATQPHVFHRAGRPRRPLTGLFAAVMTGAATVAVATVASVAAPLGTPAASASDVWSPAIDLSAPGGNATQPQVASNSSGQTMVIWMRTDPGGFDIIQGAAYTPGVGSAPGTWGPTTDLSAPGVDSLEPAVEIDDAGNATAIWRSNGPDKTIETRRYNAATGTWGGITVLSAPGGDAFGPELSVDPAGAVTAAWYRFDPSLFTQVIETRRRPAGSSSWSPVQVLSNDDFAAVISRVAADGAGNVIAIFRQDEDPNPDPNAAINVVYAARFSAASSTWTPPVRLSPAGQNTESIQVGVDPSGNATAVWSIGAVGARVIQASRYSVTTPGFTWSAPETLSVAGGDAVGPRVGADANGIVTVIWRRENAQSRSIVQGTRFTPATGTWSAPVDLSAAGQNAMAPRLAVEPSGNVTAVWVRKNDATFFTVQSARFSLSSQTWGAATNLSAPGANGETPQSDVDGDGNVIVVWARSNGTHTIIQASISSPVPGFTAVTPVRVFDTRPGSSPDALRAVDKVKVGGAQVLRVKFSGLSSGGTEITPATGVVAVSMNLAVANPEAAGYITVYPCDTRREVASVNFTAGQTVSNAVIAPLSPEGDLCFYGYAAADIIVDLNGWFPAGSGFNAVTPSRVLDTRPGGSPDALRSVAKAKVGPGNPLEVQVTSLGTLTPAANVGAVSLNVAITNPEADGFVTVYPCGPVPFTANGNYVRGQTVSNAVIAPVSAAGTICFSSLVPADIVVDINGWFSAGVGFTAAGPARVFDTRGQSPNALVTVPTARLTPATDLKVKVTDLKVSDTQTITPPTGVAAVSLNVAAVTPLADGFITVYPCGQKPFVASVNYTAGRIIPNAVIAPVDAQGYVCFSTYAPTDLVVDINGWFPLND